MKISNSVLNKEYLNSNSLWRHPGLPKDQQKLTSQFVHEVTFCFIQLFNFISHSSTFRMMVSRKVNCQSLTWTCPAKKEWWEKNDDKCSKVASFVFPSFPFAHFSTHTILKVEFLSKNSILKKTLIFRQIWIFAPKLEEILECLILKSHQKIAKNLDFDTKLNVQKN